MTANGQSRNQKQRPHRHGTTTTRTGNQPIGFFNAVLFLMFGTWPNYLPNTLSDAPPKTPELERDAIGAFAGAKVRPLSSLTPRVNP